MRRWYACCLTLARLLLRCFIPYRVIGRENIPASQTFMLASNHSSWFDPPLVAVGSNIEIGFLAKSALFALPVFGPLIRSLNAIPINRGNTDQTGLNGAATAIHSGMNLNIFPEGGRNKTGTLKPGKGGIGYLARLTHCPVVPCYISKPPHLWDCTFRRRLTTIAFGRPFILGSEYWEMERKEAHRAIAAEVMRRIAEQGEIIRKRKHPASTPS